MKRIFVSLAVMFCMSFALSGGFSKKDAPVVEKEKVFSISTNFP